MAGESLEVAGRVINADGTPADGVTVQLTPLDAGNPFDALLGAVAPGGHCLFEDCSARATGRTRNGAFKVGYLNPRADGLRLQAVAADGSRVELTTPTLGGLPDLRMWAPRAAPTFEGPLLTVVLDDPPPKEGVPDGNPGVVIRDSRGRVLLRTPYGTQAGQPADLRLAEPGAATWSLWARRSASLSDGRRVTLTFEGPAQPVPQAARLAPHGAALCTVTGATGGEKPCQGRDGIPARGTRAVLDLGVAQRVELVVAATCLDGCILETSEDGVTWARSNSLMQSGLDLCECVVQTAARSLGQVVRWLRVRDPEVFTPAERDWYRLDAYGGPTPPDYLGR